MSEDHKREALCPICNQRFQVDTPYVDMENGTVAYRSRAIVLGPQNLRLIKAMVDAYPKTITISDMVPAVWSRADEPETADNLIRNHLMHVRKLLPRIGWVLINEHGVGYRIQRK